MLNAYPESSFNDAVGTNCVYRIDLHDTSNGRDAVYVLRIIESFSTYDVMTYWGRHSSNLQSKLLITINKSTYRSNSEAMSAAYERAYKQSDAKKAKGYKLIFMNTLASSTPIAKGFDYVSLPMGVGHPPLLQPYNSPALTKSMLKDSHVLEAVGNRAHWVFVYLSNAEWHIYNISRRYLKTLHGDDMNYMNAQKHDGYVFLGYFIDATDHISVFDIIDTTNVQPDIFNIEKKPWKARRMMMTHIFYELYPKDDPYDKNLSIHLNDYSLDESDKNTLFSEYPKEGRNLLIRKVNDKLFTSLLVKTS